MPESRAAVYAMAFCGPAILAAGRFLDPLIASALDMCSDDLFCFWIFCGSVLLGGVFGAGHGWRMLKHRDLVRKKGWQGWRIQIACAATTGLYAFLVAPWVCCFRPLMISGGVLTAYVVFGFLVPRVALTAKERN